MLSNGKDVDDVVATALGHIIKARANGKIGYDFNATGRHNSTGKMLHQVPLPSVFVQDGKLYIAGETIELPVQLVVTDEITLFEQPYINALYEAYADVLNRDCIKKNDIPSLPSKYCKHFKTQRKAYFAAESIRRSIREVYSNGEEQFTILKQDAYDGIEETYYGEYKDGFERLNAVLIKITNTALSKSVLSHITNLIGTLEKKGICHILVNDEKIKSWVNIDE